MPENSAQERTEQPTPRRLRKARSRGQVAHSRELPSAFTLLALLLTLCLLGPHLLEWFAQKTILHLACGREVFAQTNAFVEFANETIVSVLLLTAPLLLAVLVAGVAGCVVVGGLNYSPEALRLRLDLINPVLGLKRLVSIQSLLTLVLSILKLVFIGAIVYFYLRNKLESLAALRWAWPGQILAQIALLTANIAARISIAVLVLAAVEAFYEKWKWKHDLRMTRQEVKEEYRQEEGPPEVKRRLRLAQFEMARKRMLQEVPKATVVLVNPTHVAVAIRYENKTMDAPVVVAKGADYLSEKIREIARAYGVPIIRRPELARTLYFSVETGQQIPEPLFVAVAEVLAMIYRLKHKKT
jgi:flagellar biosynthetic protein FlhB